MPLRSIFLARPGHHDIIRSRHTEIKAGSECFQFHQLPEGGKPRVMKVNNWTTDLPFFMPIEDLLKDHKVRSFAVIKNDTILKEYYGKNTTATDLNASYSIAKSFTSALIGIAIDEGLIGSEKDLVSKYIPEIKYGRYKEVLTIEHLLNHTTGIKYSLAADATLYYGNNALNALGRIKFAEAPGTKQHYLNVNIELLGIILQRATGVSPSKYLEDKIWKPIQMCQDGVWSADKKGLERTFCCLGATALDYAKFGRLYLNGGVWDGKRLISESWYNKSIARDTLEGSSFNYNYCWHIGLKEYGDFMAIGMYKQHIYINPKKKLIIVLLMNGENKLVAERANWWYVFRQIADQL